MLSTLKIAKRMVCEVSPRPLLKAAAFGLKGIQAVRRFNRRLELGAQFPAFMMISVTNRCNLQCQGCWVTPTPPRDMEPALLEQILRECRRQGSHFFGILGGEPGLIVLELRMLTAPVAFKAQASDNPFSFAKRDDGLGHQKPIPSSSSPSAIGSALS